MAGSAVSVTLGSLKPKADAFLSSGDYATMSEVLRDGLRALDRERAALDRIYEAKVKEALDDRRSTVPLEDAFARVRSFMDRA
ncbi:MAG: type II toxin-antitoxin system ParD family antitoxin [Pacificimonas sp.]